MSVNVNNTPGLVDSVTPGYSACGCGNRRYYTKAEIDEMFKDVLDPDEIEEILDQMFEEYIESGDLYELILNAIGDVYSKEQVDTLLSGKLDTTAFTQAMAAETARTENTYAKKGETGDYATTGWVENQGYLKDITLTINGTAVHNNGDIIIEGGGGQPVDISGKLDTSAFTAYTSTTQTWENNMEDCCDDVKTYINYLKYLIDDLQRQVDELEPEPGPTPVPTGDTYTLTAVYNVTSTTEPTTIMKHVDKTGSVKRCVDYFTYNGVDHNVTSDEVTFTFPATGEQQVTIHFIEDEIPHWCFYTTPLKRVTIPSGISTIYQNAFCRTQLTEITVPDSVTFLGMECFDSDNLATYHIGSGVTEIKEGINSRTANGQVIYINAVTPPTTSMPFKNTFRITKIYVPSASVDAYKSASGWSQYASLIEANPNN